MFGPVADLLIGDDVVASTGNDKRFGEGRSESFVLFCVWVYGLLVTDREIGAI
jgi:hypothetical protein